MHSNVIGGYKALPLKFSKDSSAEHHIFIKAHTAKHTCHDKPKGKTLFIANIPPYATELSLRNAFKGAGNISNVLFEDNQKHSFKTAYIIFNKSLSLEKALKLEYLNPLHSDKRPLQTGVAKWVTEYNDSLDLDEETLKRNIKVIVDAYDRAEVERKQEAQNANNGENDDGAWTVVTKKGRTPGLSRKESVKNKLIEKKGRKHKVLKNFYTFQIRESKKNHLATLRKKYEEDKKRVEALKQARKFKPF